MKKEWGKRHVCLDCSNAFFDMCRTEIICPKCHTEFINKAPTLKESLNLNNEFPDSEEDFQRAKFGNINIIVQELADLDAKKFIDKIINENYEEEELPINQNGDKVVN